MSKEKTSLDILLVERGLAETRSKAQALIMAGVVSVDGARYEKSGSAISRGASVSIRKKPHPFIGRGGVKLAAALDAFRVSPEGKRCLDIGASTGGFTHCLLLNGASHVTALDVGRGQLDVNLRNDPRVRVLEGVNAHHLPDALPRETFDMVVMDVSFISSRKIIPHFHGVLGAEGEAIVLVKPQFEVRKREVRKGGVVRDTRLHERVIEEMSQFLDAENFTVRGMKESPIKGSCGNREFLFHFTPRKS